MNEQIDTQNLDAPPEDRLAGIFVLPDSIEDPRIREWYEEMATRLRAEAQGVPMKTAQYLLMERICYTYANMRYQEMTNPDLTERMRQANQDAWQKMLDQFNRLLEKHNDKLMTEMLVKVQNIIGEVLSTVSDPAERQALRRRLQEEFAKIDL